MKTSSPSEADKITLRVMKILDSFQIKEDLKRILIYKKIMKKVLDLDLNSENLHLEVGIIQDQIKNDVPNIEEI